MSDKKLYRVTETWGKGRDAEKHSFLGVYENQTEANMFLSKDDIAQEITLNDVSSQHLAEYLDACAESANRHHMDGAFSQIRGYILAAAQQHIILNEPDKSSNILAAELIAKQVMWEIAKVGAWL